MHDLLGALEYVLWLSIQLGMSSSQLTNSMIFRRGRSTTHQRCFFCDLHVTPVGLVRSSLVSLVFPLRPWKAVDERGAHAGSPADYGSEIIKHHQH